MQLTVGILRGPADSSTTPAAGAAGSSSRSSSRFSGYTQGPNVKVGVSGLRWPPTRSAQCP
jgi:hypothetical protein